VRRILVRLTNGGGGGQWSIPGRAGVRRRRLRELPHARGGPATGADGPNLDELKPSVVLVQAQVTHGGGGMPAFGGRLSAARIRAVAQYVAAASRQSPG
jgi:hypothetical protein